MNEAKMSCQILKKTCAEPFQAGERSQQHASSKLRHPIFNNKPNKDTIKDIKVEFDSKILNLSHNKP